MIVVADQLTNPHDLVALTADVLREAQPGSNGLLDLRDAECLDVRVGQNASDRALRVMDAILKALDVSGAFVVPKGRQTKDGREKSMKAVIDGEPVAFFLTEQFGSVPHTPTQEELRQKKQYSWFHIPEYDLQPNGRLTLSVDEYVWTYGQRSVRKQWADGDTQRLEKVLRSFIQGLGVVAVAVRSQRMEREEHERQRRETEERRLIAERQREEEEHRIATLNTQLTRWIKSRQIREYIAEMRTTEPLIVPESELGQWLTWAEHYANSVDPIRTAIQRSVETHKT